MDRRTRRERMSSAAPQQPEFILPLKRFRVVSDSDSCTAANAAHGFKDLLDDLVCTQQNARRQLDADRPCGLEIDDQLEFCGLLDQQVGGVCTVHHCKISPI